MRPNRRIRREQGAAIITAMLVVVMAAVLVTGLFYRESIAIRSVENRLAIAQTRWIERVVIDWAQVILRVDDASVDALQDVWATPIVQTQLDETVTGGASLDDKSRQAFLTGAMIDGQSRFNVNSLVGFDGAPSQLHLKAFRRLMTLIGLPETLAENIFNRVMLAQTRTVDGRQIPAQRPPVLRMADLRDVPGIDDSTMFRLMPFITVLPRSTAVNLNTAPAEVIACLFEGLDVGRAKALVAQRERAPFSDPIFALRALGLDATRPTTSCIPDPKSPPLCDIKSNYFMVSGTIRYDRVESQTETLIRRDGQRAAAAIQVIWQTRN